MRLYVLKSVCIAGTVNFAWENSSLNTDVNHLQAERKESTGMIDFLS